MTRATINPGVCNFTAHVEALSEDGRNVKLSVQTDCPAFTKMFEDLGDTFDGFGICLAKPGTGPLFEYAQKDQKNFPIHNSCALFSGIIKVVEAECGLALPRDTSLVFEK